MRWTNILLDLFWRTAYRPIASALRMVFFWIASASIAVKLERLRSAEQALLDLATRSTSTLAQSATATSPCIRTFDTPIPVSVVPSYSTVESPQQHASSSSSSRNTACEETSSLQEHQRTTGKVNDTHNEDCYVIHGIEVTSKAYNEKSDTPLVLLHGYMNGGAYFYRNLVGLSRFFSKIYAIDQLGWGLSSRPAFPTINDTSSVHSNTTTSDENDASIQTAQDFFVESLEAWRKEQCIERMTLAGHSMGGLLSVAYCERYPQHVDRLILISPAGVPEESRALIEARKARTTWRFRLFEVCFPLCSPGDVLRAVPEWTGRRWMTQYVKRRLPAITDTKERLQLANYLYANNALPGSGEYCLPQLLKPSIFGRKPLQYRIPLLKIQTVTFLYGDMDWMDPHGGLMVEQACVQQRNLCGTTTATGAPPTIQVYTVSNAGHLLMLDNVDEFNNGMAMAVGKANQLESGAARPTRLRPNDMLQQQQRRSMVNEDTASTSSEEQQHEAIGPETEAMM